MALDTPENVTITNITGTGFTVSWDAVENADHYRILLSESPDFSAYTSYVVTAPATSRQMLIDMYNKTYYLKVRAEMTTVDTPAQTGATEFTFLIADIF